MRWRWEEKPAPEGYCRFGMIQTDSDCDGPLYQSVYRCTVCGLLVPDGHTVLHDGWHKELAR